MEPIKFICISEHETKYHTFKEGEVITPTKLNDNWWIVDSIGISDEVMNTKFNQIK